MGKVIRIARTLKASTSFPVLKLDQESSKLPGVTELAVLEFEGVEKGSENLLPSSYTETKKYIWCNSRECVRFLQVEAHNSNFQMTEKEQEFINNKLPELVEKESKRSKQEEKERQEKIKQLKSGDPKDMTGILLREVLLEMGVSFKSSDSKQKLIDKVTHARSSLNITWPIDGTTDSASELVHAQDNSLEISQPRDVNSVSIDFKNHGSSGRTAFSSETQVSFSCKFFAYYDDFDLKKKNCFT